MNARGFSFRFKQPTIDALLALAEQWECSQTQVIVRLLKGTPNGLESELVQRAVEFHCRQEDKERELAFHDAASALIESRFQLLKLGEKK